MTFQRSRSETVPANDGIAVPVTPLERNQKSCGSPCQRACSVKSAGGGESAGAAGPLPVPVVPWQASHFSEYTACPRIRLALVGATGLAVTGGGTPRARAPSASTRPEPQTTAAAAAVSAIFPERALSTRQPLARAPSPATASPAPKSPAIPNPTA